MKRGITALCVLTTLVLSACGAEGAGELLSDITARYAAARGFDARAAVCVELPDRSADFVIDWRFEDGLSTLTVAEPETIAGLSCETDDRGLTFRYADAELTVDPSGQTVSPLEALGRLYYDWAGGYAADLCRERLGDAETLAVTYTGERAGSAYTQRVWFDTARLTPLRAEYYCGEALVMRCEFLLFYLDA